MRACVRACVRECMSHVNVRVSCVHTLAHTHAANTNKRKRARARNSAEVRSHRICIGMRLSACRARPASVAPSCPALASRTELEELAGLFRAGLLTEPEVVAAAAKKRDSEQMRTVTISGSRRAAAHSPTSKFESRPPCPAS